MLLMANVVRRLSSEALTPIQISNGNQILKKATKLATSVCLLYPNLPSL